LEEKMTRRKLTLTDREYRARLLRLKQLGIPIGSAADPSPEPDRLILEQIDHAYARLFELPSGAVAVVVLARMTVLTSGMLITDLEMTTGLNYFPLDLKDPEEGLFHKDVIDWLPFSRPFLNHQLTSGTPLRPCQVEGVIVANGWSAVPPQCHDETLVRVELSLRDERRNEVCVEFGVRVDRSLKRNYERKRAILRERMPRNGRGGGLYGPVAGPLGDQKNVAPGGAVEFQHASGGDDEELEKPN
jgi:hypothetical protein